MPHVLTHLTLDCLLLPDLVTLRRRRWGPQGRRRQAAGGQRCGGGGTRTVSATRGPAV